MEKMISFEGRLYYPSHCTPLDGGDAWEYEFYNDCSNICYTIIMHPGEWHFVYV